MAHRNSLVMVNRFENSYSFVTDNENNAKVKLDVTAFKHGFEGTFILYFQEDKEECHYIGLDEIKKRIQEELRRKIRIFKTGQYKIEYNISSLYSNIEENYYEMYVMGRITDLTLIP